ncbi:cell division protein FtsH, partial [Thermodesulfobacteriota bacterium]
QIFLGKEFARHLDYSEETAKSIDNEIRTMVVDHYQKAKEIIESDKDTVEKLAMALLERETLDSNEIEIICEGKELPALPKADDGPTDQEASDHQAARSDGDVLIGGPPAAPDPEKV